MTAGNQTVGGNKTFTGSTVLDSAVSVTPTTNQIVLGTTNTTTINSTAPSASRVYTIPDAGGAANFVMSAGTQTITGNKTFSGTTTLATTNITSGGLTLPTTGGTPTTNDFYESATVTLTFSVAGSGAGLTSTPVDCKAIRNGLQCMLMIPPITVTVGASGGQNALISNALLPARFCPTTVCQTVRVQTSVGNFAIGFLVITSAGDGVGLGTVTIFSSAAAANWTAGASVGLSNDVCISYKYLT
jgi:hypothetical protein